MTSQTSLNRIGAVGTIAGAMLLVVATSLHPLEADPNDPEAAFAEYAADDLWVATHLGQFLPLLPSRSVSSHSVTPCVRVALHRGPRSDDREPSRASQPQGSCKPSMESL